MSQDAVRRLREAGRRPYRTAGGDGAEWRFLLRARTMSQPRALKDLSEQQRGLDVVQLHKLMLEETWGCRKRTFARRST